MDRSGKLSYLGLVLSSSLLISTQAFAQSDASEQEINNNVGVTQNGETDSTSQNQVQPTDVQLTEQVNAKLQEYTGKINIKVVNGVVFLSGQLPSDTDYEKAVTLTQTVPGVKDINVDQLSVQDSQQPLKDTYITAKVKGTLIKEGLFDENVPAWTIEVETKNGKVYLSGTVGSTSEKEKVLKVVNSVSGIEGVDDEIRVVESTPTENVETDEPMNVDSSEEVGGDSSDQANEDVSSEEEQ